MRFPILAPLTFATFAAAAPLAACVAPTSESTGMTSSAITPFPETCGYDPTDASSLASLMAAPIANDADADTRFQCLQQILIDRGDRRAPFATLYSMTTANVMAAVAAGNLFQDGVWVSRYLEAFAELYRASFYNYEIGHRSQVPDAWLIAFDTAKSGKELIAQDLALGVNAHVDRDLAYALVSVGIGDTPAERASRYADHTAVNDVLHAELQSAIAKIAVLYAPGFAAAPADVMQTLENVFFAGLVAGRQVAWDHAVELTDTSGLANDLVEDAIGAESTALADAILVPELSPALMAELRALEGS
jgi:hypothetical protein